MAGIAGFIIVALFLIVFYRVLGVIAVGRAADLRAVLLRAGQADPDHADAAGHRGPDPHARRRGGREHRHLRARQGGDTRRERGLGTAITTGYRKGLTAIIDANVVTLPRRVHPLHPRDRGREGLRVHARPRRDRVAVHGRAGDAGDPVLAARHAADPQPRGARRRRAALQAALRLHGRVEVVLLRLGRDPADRRASRSPATA